MSDFNVASSQRQQPSQERQAKPAPSSSAGKWRPPPSPQIASAKVSAKPQRQDRAGSPAFAQKTAHLAGQPSRSCWPPQRIVVWAVTGPLFGYSDTWQLVINTGTTIVTFLMVFLIQNSQNRDALAFQVKLDELIIKLHGAGNEIAGAEDLCDEDLEALHETYRKRAAHAHDTLEKRRAAR